MPCARHPAAILAILLLAGSSAAEDLPPATRANLAFGTDARQGIDFWQATAPGPAPLCVFFHGGGFTSGDKHELPLRYLDALRHAGFAVASANYRFAAMPAPLQDGARAVQFLRAKADELGIRKDRVVAFGGSAGALMSLWLGFHDDLAKAGAADPVERESTRVLAVGSINGQTSLDPRELRAWFGPAADQAAPLLLKIFGLKDRAELDRPSPAVARLVADCSPFGLLSEGDAAVFLQQDAPDAAIDARSLVHHPIFGRKLAERMQQLKLTVEYHGRTTDADEAENMARFLAQHAGLAAH